jgi:hypothetical protein
LILRSAVVCSFLLWEPLPKSDSVFLGGIVERDSTFLSEACPSLRSPGSPESPKALARGHDSG